MQAALEVAAAALHRRWLGAAAPGPAPLYFAGAPAPAPLYLAGATALADPAPASNGSSYQVRPGEACTYIWLQPSSSPRRSSPHSLSSATHRRLPLLLQVSFGTLSCANVSSPICYNTAISGENLITGWVGGWDCDCDCAHALPLW